MKNVLMFAAAAAAGLALADPSVTLNRVQQRYPWNGCVDIDYSVAGVTVPEDYVLRFKVSWTDETGEHIAVATNFLDYADCDLPLSDGTHRVTWDTATDGAAFRAKGVKAELDLLYAPYTLENARYMIVDISAGKDATIYPVRLAGPTDYKVFNKDLYKTSKIVLRRNEAGSFWMGDSGDASSYHYVSLTKDFYLGVFEVTRKQYWYVMGKNVGGNTNWDADFCPQKVYYDETRGSEGLLAKISARAKFKGEAIPAFVYPTESQWEYACRAGTTSKFFDGTDGTDPVEVAKYAWLKNCGSEKRAHGVGQRQANPWGYYDMIGNEWEGCSDYAGVYPTGTIENPAVDPTGPEEGTQRASKGSSCAYDSGYWGTSYVRLSIDPVLNSACIRLGLTLP